MTLHISLLAEGHVTFFAGKRLLSRVALKMVPDIRRFLEHLAAVWVLATELAVHPRRLRIPDIGNLIQMGRYACKFFIDKILRPLNQGLHPLVHQILVLLPVLDLGRRVPCRFLELL